MGILARRFDRTDSRVSGLVLRQLRRESVVNLARSGFTKDEDELVCGHLAARGRELLQVQKSNNEETRYGAHMGFPERVDSILS